MKPVLKWLEPKTTLSAIPSSETALRKFLAMFAAGTALVGFIGWATAHWDPERNPPPFWTVACLIGLWILFIYKFLPQFADWSEKRSVREIRVFKKRVVRVESGWFGTPVAEFREFDRYYWVLDEGSHFLILARRKTSFGVRSVFIRAPDSETKNRMTGFLCEIGMVEAAPSQQNIHLTPPSFGGASWLFLHGCIGFSFILIFTSYITANPAYFAPLGLPLLLAIALGVPALYVSIATAILGRRARQRYRESEAAAGA